MKPFRITFKDPDGFYESIDEASGDSLPEGLDEDEIEAVKEKRAEKFKKICEKWIKYDEYLTIEIDPEAGTCKVVEVGK